MEAGKINITGIFNKTNRLKVPYFQRSYVWQIDQWERFLDDMRYASEPTSSPYFMGSVILKQQEVTMAEENVRTIIDGQQRLTTIILFFKALFIKNGTPERFRAIFTTFRDNIILEHNYSDKEVFEKVFNDQSLTEAEKKSQIYKCYDYFLKNIKENEIDANNILSKILFVGIDLLHYDDEQQIFDTINSLGVRLTTAELLKNYLFKDDINIYNQNWREVFEKDDETKEYWEQEVTAGRNLKTNIDLFLQSYLFIKIQQKGLNVTAIDKERFFKVDSVFNSFKELNNKYNVPKEQLISEINEYAQIYRRTINPKIIESDIDKNDALQRLNIIIFALDTTTIIPYVLYLSKVVEKADERFKMFSFLELYIMRRMICNVTTKNYNQLFTEVMINNEIDDFKKLVGKIEEQSQANKNNYLPSNEEVRSAFSQSWLTNRQSRGILYLLEKTIRNDKQSTTLKPIISYSVEHLMPKKWKNNWYSEQMTQEEMNKRDSLLLTLGNLTLITQPLNSSIRDAAWADKKSGTNGNKGLLEYAQGMEILSKYLRFEEWNESGIKQRAEEMANLALNCVWVY